MRGPVPPWRCRLGPLAFFYNKFCYECDPFDMYHDQLEGIDSFILIDARSEENYLHEHISGAIRKPHKTMSLDTTRDLQG
jgi:hypothetical protein